MRLGGAILATACLLALSGCGGAANGQPGESGSPKASTAVTAVTPQRITQPITESADGRVLHTRGYAGGCERAVHLSAAEKDGEVTLKLLGITRSAPPCPQDARWVPVQVTLPEPVGHHTLIDGTSGKQLHIQGIWRAGLRSG